MIWKYFIELGTKFTMLMHLAGIIKF